MIKPFDIILAGGGAAGLSLACHLVHSPLRDCSMLIIDRDAKERNDRIWCFWTDHQTLFDAIVSYSWNQLQILDAHMKKTLDLSPYRYQMIRGRDFYRSTHQTLSGYPSVKFLQGNIERIEDGEPYASVLVDGQEYRGRWVFESLFNGSAFQPDERRYHSLKQQFKGWEIETQEKAFNPQVATFFDFRTSQEKGMRFFYVLPFSEREALVESVLCAPVPVDWQACQEALETYLEDVLYLKRYRVVRDEQGISPLTDQPFPRCIRHVMTIGIPGGKIKPSTGYAFMRIQEDATAIVRSLLEAGHPFNVPSSPRRYRFFDAVMLSIMAHHAEWMRSMYMDLFEHNRAERILRFLDEKASLVENARMLPDLPPKLLWQTVLHLDTLLKV